MPTDPLGYETYTAYLEAEIDRTKARTAALRIEIDHKEAEGAALRAEIAATKARISTPWLANWPFLRSFLLLGLPVLFGFFVLGPETNRTVEEAPTGIAIAIGVTLFIGGLITLIRRYQTRRANQSNG